MADPPQQQDKPKEEKMGFFRIKYLQARNFAVRHVWPFNRGNLGRFEIPGKPHPLERELEQTWIEKNKHMMKVTLKQIEGGWDEQGYAMGLSKDKAKKMEGYLGDPDGITTLYRDFTVYAGEHERIEDEVKWFREGTGYFERDEETQFPSRDIQEKYGWDPKKVAAMTANRIQMKSIREGVRTKFLDVRPGSVIHEGKMPEELYIFGFEHAKKIGGVLMKVYEETIQLDYLRQKGVTTEVRTKATNAIKEISKLMEEISKIEEENYNMLAPFSGQLGEIDTKWNIMLSKKAPEYSANWKIRFPHTYMVAKPYAIMEITEEIEIPGKPRYPVKRKVVSPLDPAMHTVDATLGNTLAPQNNNIYTREFADIQTKLQNLKNKIDTELGDTLRKIRGLQQATRRPDLFPGVVRALFARKRNGIITVLNSADTPENKYAQISNLLTANLSPVYDIIPEVLDDYKVVIIDIIRSAKTSNEKFDDIQRLVLDSLKLSTVINNFLKSRISNMKFGLNPLDEKGNAKDPDDIIASLMDSIHSPDEEINNVLVAVAREFDKPLKKLVVNQNFTIDKKVELFINYVNMYIVRKNLEKDHALPLIKLQSMLDKQQNITSKYEQIKKRLDNRALEIQHIRNKQPILDEIKPRIPNTTAGGFDQRPEEIHGYGLDEYGYPLEIDPKHNGMVLIDKWWRELGTNQWQLMTIASKAGGREVLDTHLGLNVTYANTKPVIAGVPNRSQRYITDKRFYGKIDLMELGILLYGYWDAVRDDYRDGRYHPHSKSIMDYVIEGMGGFHETKCAPYFRDWIPNIDYLRRSGVYLARRGIKPLPTDEVHVHLPDMEQALVNATPYHFMAKDEVQKAWKKEYGNTPIPPWLNHIMDNPFAHIPSDEKAITRDYKMRLRNFANPKSGTRTASKYNPGFDRRAQHIEQMVHWGRMYYWEWAGGINRWSENPFPHVSTRGIAQYMAYLASIDMYHYASAEKVMEHQIFDYGTRGSGMYPEMNPLSGKDIVGEKTEN